MSKKYISECLNIFLLQIKLLTKVERPKMFLLNTMHIIIHNFLLIPGHMCMYEDIYCRSNRIKKDIFNPILNKRKYKFYTSEKENEKH